MIKYSASVNAFYDTDINKTIPADAIEISPVRHQELQQGQTQGFEIRPGADGNPINAPVKPRYATGWDTVAQEWTVDVEAQAAAQAAAEAKAAQLAALGTRLQTAVDDLNTRYPGMNLTATDSFNDAAGKMLIAEATWDDVSRVKLIYDIINNLK